MKGKEKELLRVTLAGIQLGQKVSGLIAEKSGNKSTTELLIDKYQTTHLSWQLLKSAIDEVVQIKKIHPSFKPSSWVADILQALPTLETMTEAEWAHLRDEVTKYPNF